MMGALRWVCYRCTIIGRGPVEVRLYEAGAATRPAQPRSRRSHERPERTVAGTKSRGGDTRERKEGAPEGASAPDARSRVEPEKTACGLLWLHA